LRVTFAPVTLQDVAASSRISGEGGWRITDVRKSQMVTDRELEILKVLWTRGRASVRDVQDDLNQASGTAVAYSTVQTLLNIMEEKKGLVRHTVEGRTFIYSPRKTPERTIRELTRRFVDRVFDGALDQMMVALLETRPPSPQELDRIRTMLDEAERQVASREPLIRASEAD
jgi:BlaI family penicillinase repressor